LSQNWGGGGVVYFLCLRKFSQTVFSYIAPSPDPILVSDFYIALSPLVSDTHPLLVGAEVPAAVGRAQVPREVLATPDPASRPQSALLLRSHRLRQRHEEGKMVGERVSPFKTVCINNQYFSKGETESVQSVLWIRISFNADPDPAFFANADPGPGFWWPKIGKKLQLIQKFVFVWSKFAFYLSLGLRKGRPSYRRSLHSSKENI
jgi:hypothetical protein